MDKQEFLRLLDKYLVGKASDQEIEILENYYNSFQDKRQWNEPELGSSQELESRMLDQIKGAINKQKPVVPIFQRRWFQVAAAAVVLLVIGASVWWPVQNKTEQTIADSKANKSIQKIIKNNHAVLLLGNGEVIDLDSISNGVVAYIDQLQIIKQDSQLVYQPSMSEHVNPPADITYHTVSIPRGEHYKVVLPDGSMVWLNAASSLRYPTSFKGKDRRVELRGEAYFEVAKDKARPFQVYVSAQHDSKQNGALVEVLGTHFNINAYDDEELLKTTLVEGSVKVTPIHSSGVKRNDARILVPGQQAQITGQMVPSDGITVETVDVDKELAWKNNLFYFSNADIQTIMRQIARWYDVEVVYEGSIPVKNFTGKIVRSSDLKTVQKILEESGIHFLLEGNKIIVRP